MDHTLQRAHNSTWTTHTAENTTLLDYKKLYTYMCNIVTEFYLYSIVYIYLINSRLDVTHSVRHHFRMIQTLSWCQRVVRISRNREKSYSDQTHTYNNNDGKSREEFTHTHSISRGFLRGLFEYSDFFQDHTL